MRFLSHNFFFLRGNTPIEDYLEELLRIPSVLVAYWAFTSVPSDASLGDLGTP